MSDRRMDEENGDDPEELRRLRPQPAENGVMTPARRAALEALERELRDLVGAGRP